MKTSLKASAALSPVSLTVAVALSFGAAMLCSSSADAAWSCVPYARQVSDVQLKGDAWRWWDAATGVYAKGHTPKPGSVLVFRRTGEMRRGHVAVVRQVVSSRKIIVDHANWSRHGGIDHDVAIVDVSPRNDWSETRVWYGPIHDYGDRAYPTYGFIYAPGRATMQAAVSTSDDNDDDDSDAPAPTVKSSPHLIEASYTPPEPTVPAAAAELDTPAMTTHKIAHAKITPMPEQKPGTVVQAAVTAATVSKAPVTSATMTAAVDTSTPAAPLPERKPAQLAMLTPANVEAPQTSAPLPLRKPIR